MNEIGYFFVAILTTVGLSGSFSREYASGMDQLLLSSRFGRSKLATAKLAVAVIYCTGIVVMFWNFKRLLFLTNDHLHAKLPKQSLALKRSYLSKKSS